MIDPGAFEPEGVRMKQSHPFPTLDSVAAMQAGATGETP